jgi:hypothetical protein
MSLKTVKKTAFFRRKEEKKEIEEQMRVLPREFCIVAAVMAGVIGVVLIFAFAGPFFGFSFLVIALIINFLIEESCAATNTEKNVITRLKEKYPTALPVAIAVSPGVVALFTPAAIAGPVVFGTVVAAIIVGNTIEFFF